MFMLFITPNFSNNVLCKVISTFDEASQYRSMVNLDWAERFP